MVQFLPRSLYILACAACFMLVWQNPIMLFLAACFSCLTLPVYRKLANLAQAWRQKLSAKSRQTPADRALLRLAAIFPISAYALFILIAFFTPIATLILLVSPQAAAGLSRLRELREANFQMPAHWVEYIARIREEFAKYPTIEKALNDTINNLDSMFTSYIGLLVSQGFGFLGSTLTLLWLTFLFLMLTILFTRYARDIRKVCSRILRLPNSMLGRFIIAVHKALKGVMLGIVLVALVQGTLCGIAFYFAGINQPAFWGLLATLVAPIPAIGTAFVWFPLCVMLWFTGKTVAAIGVALWGALFVSGVDNVLRPFFLRQGIKAPFLVLIIVILCGLSSFGAVGLIAGPVLLAIALQALEEANNYYGKAN
ncbi:MAG: AI-2E family transporter [Desulfovibrio sp.]|nr:AI-2E family transporter [Desulfovibrio sp.]